MVEPTTTLLGVIRLAVAVLGVSITRTAYRAYRRTGATHLRYSSVGFGIMTVGVLSQGILFEFADLTITEVHILESITIALAFVVLVLSIHR